MARTWLQGVKYLNTKCRLQSLPLFSAILFCLQRKKRTWLSYSFSKLTVKNLSKRTTNDLKPPPSSIFQICHSLNHPEMPTSLAFFLSIATETDNLAHHMETEKTPSMLFLFFPFFTTQNQPFFSGLTWLL